MGQPSLPKKNNNSPVRRKFSQHLFSYSSADKSLARPGTKQANVSVRMAWISYGALPCRKRNLMTARVSMLLKSPASLSCFRACFFPVRAKDLSAPGGSRSQELLPPDVAQWLSFTSTNSKNFL